MLFIYFSTSGSVSPLCVFILQPLSRYHDYNILNNLWADVTFMFLIHFAFIGSVHLFLYIICVHWVDIFCNHWNDITVMVIYFATPGSISHLYLYILQLTGHHYCYVYIFCKPCVNIPVMFIYIATHRLISLLW